MYEFLCNWVCGCLGVFYEKRVVVYFVCGSVFLSVLLCVWRGLCVCVKLLGV